MVLSFLLDDSKMDSPRANPAIPCEAVSPDARSETDHVILQCWMFKGSSITWDEARGTSDCSPDSMCVTVSRDHPRPTITPELTNVSLWSCWKNEDEMLL